MAKRGRPKPKRRKLKVVRPRINKAARSRQQSCPPPVKYFFYQTFIKVMCKFSKLIHSKRFWTLVASIVAALTAFFVMEGCSAQRKVVVTGAYVDSLYYETSTVIKN